MNGISIDFSTKPKFICPALLLHPRIPLYLSGVNPRTIKGKEWWDVTRRKAYAENNHCCWACNVYQLDAAYRQVLEAHECYEYDPKTFTARMISVVALCSQCHQFIHWGRIRKLSPQRLKGIILRGLNLLYEAGEPLPSIQLGVARKYLWISPLKYADVETVSPPYTPLEFISTRWKLTMEEE